MSIRCRTVLTSIFFFQAEDGIRDLVRSRGLGDVYKRQSTIWQKRSGDYSLAALDLHGLIDTANSMLVGSLSVSYTHLTLPTSDLV